MTRQSIEERILTSPQPIPLPQTPANPRPVRPAWRVVRNAALLGAFAVVIAAAVG